MEAFKLFAQWWGVVKAQFAYAGYCVENPISTIVCRDFWTWTLAGSFGIALILAFMIGKSVIREQLEFYRNRKRLEARKIVADEEVMNQHKWVGDSNTDVDLSQEELAAAMRTGIQSKKVAI